MFLIFVVKNTLFVDDEEDVRPPQDVLQRSNGGPRPSVADLPGTSGMYYKFI